MPVEKVSFVYEAIEEAYAPEKESGDLDAAFATEFNLTAGPLECKTPTTALE